jgi:hypothetical protein
LTIEIAGEPPADVVEIPKHSTSGLDLLDCEACRAKEQVEAIRCEVKEVVGRAVKTTGHRRREVERSSRPEDAEELPDDGLRIGDIIENLHADNRVKSGRFNRDVTDVAEIGVIEPEIWEIARLVRRVREEALMGALAGAGIEESSPRGERGRHSLDKGELAELFGIAT